MSAERPLLAVYGTLRTGQRNHGLLGPSAELLGVGRISGCLRLVPGEHQRPYPYPALLVAPQGSGEVVVEVYRLNDPGLLVELDRLEGYDPVDEASSEYLRRPVEVHGLRAGTLTAWAYPYAGPLDALHGEVPGGDWSAVSP